MTNTASKLKKGNMQYGGNARPYGGITSVPVLAASPGIYTATATSHYSIRTTGKSRIPAARGSSTSWASP